MSSKKVVILSLTDAHDERLDKIAAENVDLVGRSLRGEPNRSAVVKALIDMCNSAELRAYLETRRQAA